jgi:transcriptional regulator with XRE-family HTH domain
MASVGEVVHWLRSGTGMSISTLATSADLSPGLLSQIERGMGNPSFSTLMKLAAALGVSVNTFFIGEAWAGQVLKKGTHPRLEIAGEDLVYELITPQMNGEFGMVRLTIPPGWSNEDSAFRHAGEECMLVERGELLVVVGGRRYLLEEGDSITHDATVPHWYHNEKDVEALIISAMSPPLF